MPSSPQQFEGRRHLPGVRAAFATNWPRSARVSTKCSKRALKAGLTQAEVAERMGTTQSAVVTTGICQREALAFLATSQRHAGVGT